MRRVITTSDYDRAIKRFPARIRTLADQQIKILSLDWRDSRLHIKKMRGYDNLYSFRVTRNYRALFYFDVEDDIIVFDADDRKDSYR